MQSPSIPATDPVAQAGDRTGTFWRGALVGGVPIALLAVIVGAALLISTFARMLTASGGFFAQQQATLIVLVVGSVLAALGYISALIWAWRWQRRQYLAGAIASTKGALMSFALTSLLMLLPLILAIVLPPHPAP